MIKVETSKIDIDTAEGNISRQKLNFRGVKFCALLLLKHFGILQVELED